ncbi:MAG: trans-sialidase, partial [Nitrosarchaeum sp.]
VPTTNWNDQKPKVPGYTQPSNQYFATRARLAYHPADKTFGSFSGVALTVDGSVAQTQQAPPPPKPSKGTLPKGSTQKEPEQVQVSSYDSGSGKSRKEELEEYEKNYLARLEQQRVEEEKEYQKAVEAEVKARASATRGSLPKGFESKPAPEAPKASRGTLPKGF